MKVFIFTILIGISLVGVFVFFMDPSSNWRDAPTPFSRDLTEDEIRITPNNFDERSVQASHIQFIGSPDIVLFGSSRVRIINSQFFNSKLKVFNAGVSSASIEDFLGLWQAIKERNLKPSYVIIFSDPWQFDETTSRMLTGWHNIEKYVNDYFKENDLKPSTLPTKIIDLPVKTQWSFFNVIGKPYLNVERNLNIAKEIVSWPMVRAAFTLFFKEGLTGDRLTQKIIKKTERLPDETGILKDGSFVFPEKELQIKSLDVLENSVNKYLVKNEHNLGHWVFDETVHDKFEKFIKNLRQNGIQVLVIFPPFHPSLYKMMVERNAFTQILEKARTAQFDAKVCNAENPETVGCTPTDFMDAVHMQMSCAVKTLKFCLKENQWKNLLSGSVMQMRITKSE